MNFADLLSSPSKAALKMLSAFATDAKEHDRLVTLCSLGRRGPRTMNMSTCRSGVLLEVMRDFSSAKPSIGAFFRIHRPETPAEVLFDLLVPKNAPEIRAHHVRSRQGDHAHWPDPRGAWRSTWLAKLRRPGNRLRVFFAGVILQASAKKVPRAGAPGWVREPGLRRSGASSRNGWRPRPSRTLRCTLAAETGRMTLFMKKR